MGVFTVVGPHLAHICHRHAVPAQAQSPVLSAFRNLQIFSNPLGIHSAQSYQNWHRIKIIFAVPVFDSTIPYQKYFLG